MRALVSGQSGVALVQDGEAWYVVRLQDSEPLLRRKSTAYRLLEHSNDVEVLADVNFDSIQQELEIAHARDTALQYVLVLLEELGPAETQRAILNRLTKLMPFRGVHKFILNRLYAAPLKLPALDNARALIVANRDHPLASLLEEVIRNQAAIGNLRSAWEHIRGDIFDSPDKRNEFFFSILERGFVRDLVLNPEAVLVEPSLNEKQKALIRNWRAAAEAAQVPSDYSPEIPSITLLPTHRPGVTRGIVNEPSVLSEDNRHLINIEVQEKLQLFRESLAATIRAEHDRFGEPESVAISAISACSERLIYQIRDDFTGILKKWGLRLNVDRLRLLKDFRQQLLAFKQEVKSRKYDPKLEEAILGPVDAAVEKLKERTSGSAGDAFDMSSTRGRVFQSKASVLDPFLPGAEELTRALNSARISNTSDLPREVVAWGEIELVSVEDIKLAHRFTRDPG